MTRTVAILAICCVVLSSVSCSPRPEPSWQGVGEATFTTQGESGEVTTVDRTQTPSETAGSPSQLSVLCYHTVLSGAFELTGSLTDQERAQLLTGDLFGETEDTHFPSTFGDAFWGESLFLQKGESGRVTVQTPEPSCYWWEEPEFDSGVLVMIGPAYEYTEEWPEQDWPTDCDSLAPRRTFLRTRTNEGWAVTFDFETCVAGHYRITVLNQSHVPIHGEYSVALRIIPASDFPRSKT